MLTLSYLIGPYKAFSLYLLCLSICEKILLSFNFLCFIRNKKKNETKPKNNQNTENAFRNYICHLPLLCTIKNHSWRHLQYKTLNSNSKNWYLHFLGVNDMYLFIFKQYTSLETKHKVGYLLFCFKYKAGQELESNEIQLYYCLQDVCCSFSAF